MISWVPMESNPEVMTKFLQRLGVPEAWSVVDVYGFEPELLLTVPRPVLAVILLFPTSTKYEEQTQQQDKEIDKKKISEKVFFVKQTIGNACGTMALIHSVANNTDQISLSDGPLKSFLTTSASLTPEERGSLLLKAEEIASVHQEVAQEGQSAAPDASENVDFHFVAFVHVEGGLYELNGDLSSPVYHGTTTPDSLLEDATVVCQAYMTKDPENPMFSVMALAATD